MTDCEIDIRVSSDANPGIRMLWFRSVFKQMNGSQKVSRVGTYLDVVEGLVLQVIPLRGVSLIGNRNLLLNLWIHPLCLVTTRIKVSRVQYQSDRLTSSTSGSIFTLGSILVTSSCIERRILWSFGEFFRRLFVSLLSTLASSAVRESCEGVPVVNMRWPFHINMRGIPDILPPGIPPLKVGRPCWAVAQVMGPGLVVLKVVLIGKPPPAWEVNVVAAWALLKAGLILCGIVTWVGGVYWEPSPIMSTIKTRVAYSCCGWTRCCYRRRSYGCSSYWGARGSWFVLVHKLSQLVPSIVRY